MKNSMRGNSYLLSQFIKSALNKDGKKSAFYTLYTILFLIMALACFSWFIVWGYSFIYEGDGWHQHFIALVYYAKYLKGIIRNLVIEHQLVIPGLCRSAACSISTLFFLLSGFILQACLFRHYVLAPGSGTDLRS